MKTYTITEDQLREIDGRLSQISVKGADTVHMASIFALLSRIIQAAEAPAADDGKTVDLFEADKQEAA